MLHATLDRQWKSPLAITVRRAAAKPVVVSRRAEVHDGQATAGAPQSGHFAEDDLLQHRLRSPPLVRIVVVVGGDDRGVV